MAGRAEDNVSTVVEFYDGLADDYHLVYGDRWDEAIDRQGVLDGLIRTHDRSAVDVLDRACGIGTQAIGLAKHGYRVVGSDISERELERAALEATRHGVQLELIRDDFRSLTGIGRLFDVVICCDNALPHLLQDDEIDQAFTSMYSNPPGTYFPILGIHAPGGASSSGCAPRVLAIACD
jgi:glycine/sarcosine N-methyltransferase